MELAKAGAALFVRVRLRRESPRTVGPWLRQELQRLGPLTSKLGQWASNRKDIFGDYAQELEDLQANVDPMPIETVRDLLRNTPLEDVSDAPIAAASIGQVHTATLHGHTVAVKVQRPDALASLEASARLASAATWLLRALNTPSAADLDDILQDILRSFRAETDFLQEAEAMHSFAKTSPRNVVVPRPRLELCTDRILVMDYVPSTPILEFGKSLPRGRRRALAVRLMKVFMEQLLETELLHADLHPGNYGVRDEHTFVLYDFGNVVTISENLRFAIKSFMLTMVTDNPQEAVRIVRDDLRLKIVDEASLETWIRAYFEYTKTPGLDAYSTFSGVDNPRVQPVIFSGDLTRIMRAFSSLEGVCTALDPSFQYYELFETFVESILLSQDFMERKARRDAELLWGRFLL